MKLFLQQPAALAHLDDGVIEAIEPLRELAGAKPQGRLQIVEMLLLEPVEHDPQARQLPMQAAAGAPQAAEVLAQIRLALSDSTFSSTSSRACATRSAMPSMVSATSFDDRLQQRGDAFDAMARLRARGGWRRPRTAHDAGR